MEARVESVRRAYEWLQDRLASTQQTMHEANETLLESYESQNLVVSEGTVSASTTSIARLNEEFVAAQTRRIALEAALKQFSGMRSQGQSLGRVPQVASDGVILDFNRQLAALEVDLSRLQEKFKEAHPEVQKIKAQIDPDPQGQAGARHRDRAGDAGRVPPAPGSRGRAASGPGEETARAADLSRKIAGLETLKKEADTASNLYSVLLQKLSETNIAASVQNDNVRVVQRAWRPNAPIWPQKKQDRRHLRCWSGCCSAWASSC